MTASTDIPVRVTDVTPVTGRIRRFRLEHTEGLPLPLFSGGAHVVVSIQDGGRLRRNPYSLMSSPLDTSAYEISVLRVDNSRGGSAFLHDAVRPGHELKISQPVNLFSIDRRARKHLLIAGGIGITPFMASIAQLEREGLPFELHYAIRSRSHGAYWQELLDRYGPHRVHVYSDEEGRAIALGKLLQFQPLGTHLYVCGPGGMIDATLECALRAGWPAQNLHSERFLAPPPGKSFRIVLQRSGRELVVEEHQSILEAVEAAGIEAPFLCRGGACGQCETAVVECSGRLEHNDHYLPAAEKAAGQKLMICVSRLDGSRLVLDL
jgi:dimethylamine monooxygenase subunit B